MGPAIGRYRSIAAAQCTAARRANARQCRIKVGAIDAAALGPLKKSVTAADEKTRKVFCIILVVISVVGTVSGESLKLLPPDVIF